MQASILQRVRRRLARRLDEAADRRPRVHFLHIGKNGGSALKAFFDDFNADRGQPVRIAAHGHRVKLRDLPADARYVFAVRDPITRFSSGFYSRKRQGRPRLFSPWSPAEAGAFARFEHAAELAAAIEVPGETGAAAIAAMRAIEHVRDLHLDWFDDVHEVLHRRPPVHILRQEHLEADLAVLLARLGADAPARLPRDDTRSHRNDYAGAPALDDRARAALERWYAADIAFVALARAWADANAGAEAQRRAS